MYRALIFIPFLCSSLFAAESLAPAASSPAPTATSLAPAATSLAPPAARAAPGAAVPVTAHPDQHSLLHGPLPELAQNKALVYDFWRNVIVAGKAEDAPRYISASYTEHNPALPNGAYAFQEYVADRLVRNPLSGTIDGLVTIVAEGPYVALVLLARYLENDGSGASYTSTRFELFRIEGGLITEHWDSKVPRAGQVAIPPQDRALPVRGSTGPAQHAAVANADPALFAHKRLVFDLTRQVIDAGREELAGLYVDPVYIRHDPSAAASAQLFAPRADVEMSSTLAAPLVALLAEGDLVIQVLAAEQEVGPTRYTLPRFDMFRIAGGRVAEHWNSAVKGDSAAAMPQATPFGQ